ncbi:MAG TPA: alkaline phosphatase family protein [Solirubrobacteraceae bacterium]|nr:alkaline phosphatase family protein [Solirubrobacteraceae bacterium]
MSADPGERCAECGSPLGRGQRYCLDCGARHGSRSPQLLALLEAVDSRSAVPAPAEPLETAGPVERPAPGFAAGLALPGPKISTLLVLVFLGFGVLLGGAAGSSVNATLAASARGHVKLVLPAPASSIAPAPSPSGSASEPPVSEETPTPAEAPPAKTAPGSAAPAATTTSSAGGEGGSGSGSSGSAPRGSSSKLPAVKHVFVIMLSNQPYAAAFGPASSAPYLSHTLEGRGELLTRYDAVAHEQLANGIALLSGQGPTVETAANCPTYADVTPAGTGQAQQVTGNGCVYPPATRTLLGQLAAKHLSWRAYVQGIEAGGAPVNPACSHPALGAADPTAAVPPAPGAYATFRNTPVYFHSVIDSPSCRADDVGLGKLGADLSASARTPAFSYIVPDRCHDGSLDPCSPGAPAGMPAADGFLRSVVPEIIRSKAYKDGGLLVITVDEAPSGGEFADSSSCCGQPLFPNLPTPATGLSRRGGGAVGALLLSPFVKGATTSQEPYNHFSLLRTIEDLFGLGHLGYAGAAGVGSFEPSLFSH